MPIESGTEAGDILAWCALILVLLCIFGRIGWALCGPNDGSCCC